MFDGVICIFIFHDTVTTEIYTLSLHDALPIFNVTGTLTYDALKFSAVGARISGRVRKLHKVEGDKVDADEVLAEVESADRKSTRLNSSHVEISYAVFCLKKKKKNSPATRSRPH